MTTRRGFFGFLAGLLWLPCIGHAEVSHLYSWKDGPFTTDPLHRRTFGYGGKVFCDGVLVNPDIVRCCVTGPHGWVECMKRDDKGNMVVVVRDREGNEHCPKGAWQKWDANGRPFFIASELVVVRIYGNVKYIADARNRGDTQ